MGLVRSFPGISLLYERNREIVQTSEDVVGEEKVAVPGSSDDASS